MQRAVLNIQDQHIQKIPKRPLNFTTESPDSSRFLYWSISKVKNDLDEFKITLKGDKFQTFKEMKKDIIKKLITIPQNAQGVFLKDKKRFD